jgi:hypothetical protein
MDGRAAPTGIGVDGTGGRVAAGELGEGRRLAEELDQVLLAQGDEAEAAERRGNLVRADHEALVADHRPAPAARVK